MSELAFTSFSGTTRPTSFGIYDSDPLFQRDADNVVYYVQRNMGTPILDGEIDLRQVWSAFEQATIEYSSVINTHHARNIMLDLLGSGTGSLSGSENAMPTMNTAEFARKITLQYAHEFGANSPWPWHTASITTKEGVQTYNIFNAISSSVPDGASVQIRKIHHYEPTTAFRFFDTTSVLNFMGNAMGFQSYSPETIFYLLPLWEDVLRGTQLQLNQRIRRSNYSFDLRGFELRVYPTPTREQKIFFEWTTSRDALSSSIGGQSLYQSKGVVSNLSNVAFGHLGYSDINSIGKTWIWRMTLAFCKEITGLVRAKYREIPIPTGGSVSLNGQELIQQGREEQANLRQELRETLEAMSYKNLAVERNELEQVAIESWKRVPLLIYRSR